MSDEWINVRSMGYQGGKRAPNIDKVVSKIVGKTVMATDSRLLKFLAEKRRQKSEEVDDNFLRSEENREELKKLFT